MKTNTNIANDIRVAGGSANLDATCKRVLSEKSILAWILQGCAEEYKDIPVEEIAEKYIEGTPQVGRVTVAPDTTNAPKIHGADKEDTSLTEGNITYDILFHTAAPSSGEEIRLIVNVEAQNDFYPGYPLIKRGIYYCSRMISAQNGTEFTESHYGDIKKVYSIWICTKPPKNREYTINRYRIIEENLVGDVKEKRENYDLIHTVILCLGDANKRKQSDVLKLLSVLLSPRIGEEDKRRILEYEFAIPMTQPLEREVSLMCNLSKGVEEMGIQIGLERGRAEGREEGRAEGHAEGRAEGHAEGRTEGVVAMVAALKELSIPSETIIRQLCDKFGLTKQKAQSYL